LAKSFDRVAEIYDDTRGLPPTIMDSVLEAMDLVLDKRRRVLDAGTGTGRFSSPLQSRGFDVVGVDISSRMLEKAMAKGVRDLLKADLCALPFRDRAFGSAVSVHVMHLISTWRCALGEVARVTEGRFVSVSTVRDDDSPYERLRMSYDGACARRGYEVKHPGLRERELSNFLKPDETMRIATNVHVHDTAEALRKFGARIFSDQWDVPEEVHSAAVEEMRRAYEGVPTIENREEISLLVWDMERVRGFLAAEGR
jgi:SAM-dependent methyltransferase